MALIFNQGKYRRLCRTLLALFAESRRQLEDLGDVGRALRDAEIYLQRIQQNGATASQIAAIEKTIESRKGEKVRLQKLHEEHQGKVSRVGALKNQCEYFLRAKGVEISE